MQFYIFLGGCDIRLTALGSEIINFYFSHWEKTATPGSLSEINRSRKVLLNSIEIRTQKRL